MEQETLEGRQVRAARSQALFRRANERMEYLAEEWKFTANDPGFLCECADLGCTEQMALSVDEYEAVRRHPTRFAVVSGHAWPDVERVVEANARYSVVEMFGEAGLEAVSLDRRSAGVEATSG
jgi:hypothetical protein